MKKKIDIVYQDDDLVVVNKPPFLLTIPDRYALDKPNVYHFLNENIGKVYTVHRLDKETSGILVFAKTEMAHKALSQQFEARSAEKYYYTLVEGNMYLDEGTIDKPIAPSFNRRDKMVINDKGKPSITDYKVVERFKQFTLVEANIKTGRTHQIRVHFEAIGYPLMVDAIYGRRDAFYLSEVKQRKYRLGKEQEERPLIERSILHAHRLVLTHPTTQERKEWTADMPKDFGAVVKQLRKWGK